MTLPTPTTSPSGRPLVVALGTGGTIAGSAEATQDHGYVAGVVDIGDLVRAVPGVADVADVEYLQVMQRDSCDLDLSAQLEIVRHVQRAADRPGVAGVVVTHGTDTLEESAYLAHLLVRTAKPVVFVGAMRPADAPGADGPGNLLDAVIAAAAPECRGLGTLVVMCGEIHGAREVAKRHATSVGAFASQHGPLGSIVGNRVDVRARPTRRFGDTSAFRVEDLPSTLPPVEVLVGRAGLPTSLLDAIRAAGAQGLVHVGHGAGNVPTDLQPALRDAAGTGLVVVRTTRVGDGTVARNGAVSDDALGTVAAGDLGIGKARILLSLALTRTQDPREVQRVFDTH